MNNRDGPHLSAQKKGCVPIFCKLVLNGRLVEGAPPEDDVHLADIEADMAESANLAAEYPDVTADLKAAAEAWRAGIEDRWQNHWLPKANGTTTHS